MCKREMRGSEEQQWGKSFRGLEGLIFRNFVRSRAIGARVEKLTSGLRLLDRGSRGSLFYLKEGVRNVLARMDRLI